MQLAWVAYILALSLVAGLAALCAEQILRHFEVAGTRWAWVAALLASTGLPAGALLVPGAADWITFDLTRALPGAGELVHSLPAGVRGTQWALVQDLPDLRPLLVGASAVVLAVAALWLLHGYRTLVRRERRWREGEVDGRKCLLSRETGPAIVGVFRHRLVLPEWIRDLPLGQRRMILDHEEEHLRRRDPWLLAVAYASLLCFPWNPVLWWQVRRLRLAVEVDCDRRVAGGRDDGDRASYSELLLALGRTDRPSPATAFARGESGVGRRIRELLEPTRLGAGGLAVRAVGGLLLAATLLLLPRPILPYRGEGPPASMSQVNPTPYDRDPVCLNCEEVRERIRRVLGDMGREVSVREPVAVGVRVTERGRVQYTTLHERFEEKERPAVRRVLRSLVLKLRFEPARLNGEPTVAWLYFMTPSPEQLPSPEE